MHPEVVSDEPGRCPECGMKLMPARSSVSAAGGHEHDHEHHEHAEHEPRPATTTTTRGGIEWEDDMVEVNRMTTPANMRWKLVDRDDRRRERTRSTGASGSATG